MLTDLHEALRYCGIPSPDDVWTERMRQVALETEARIRPRWVWKHFMLQKTPGGIALQDTPLVLTGQTASTMLQTCDEAVLLAVTLGPEMDAMLRTARFRGMDGAVLLDACGSALAEAGCNEAEKEIAAAYPGLYLTDRFSPGYGDLPLDCQGPLLQSLDARRRCGISLTSSCLMIPSKSVTAVIGLSHEKQRARIRGCAFCALRESCTFRQGGKRCVE